MATYKISQECTPITFSSRLDKTPQPQNFQCIQPQTLQDEKNPIFSATSAPATTTKLPAPPAKGQSKIIGHSGQVFQTNKASKRVGRENRKTEWKI